MPNEAVGTRFDHRLLGYLTTLPGSPLGRRFERATPENATSSALKQQDYVISSALSMSALPP